MGKYRDRTVCTVRANGINYSIQMRSLNWREIDARAEAIVCDPSRRLSERERRKLGGLNDVKPKRGGGRRMRLPGE
jgi:hypothetical protein